MHKHVTWRIAFFCAHTHTKLFCTCILTDTRNYLSVGTHSTSSRACHKKINSVHLNTRTYMYNYSFSLLWSPVFMHECRISKVVEFTAVNYCS